MSDNVQKLLEVLKEKDAKNTEHKILLDKLQKENRILKRDNTQLGKELTRTKDIVDKTKDNLSFIKRQNEVAINFPKFFDAFFMTIHDWKCRQKK